MQSAAFRRNRIGIQLDSGKQKGDINAGERKCSSAVIRKVKAAESPGTVYHEALQPSLLLLMLQLRRPGKSHGDRRSSAVS